MSTPARQHYHRKAAAAQAALAADADNVMTGSVYELMQAKLAEDRRRLKQVQSIEKKIELKRKYLPEYAPYIAGVLEAGTGAQDDVLTTIMTWRIDVADFTGALEIAGYVLQHNITLPDRFARTTATLIAEEMAEQADGALAINSDFDVAVLLSADEMTAEHDMPDQVRAKLHKAIGQCYLQNVDFNAVTDDAVQAAQKSLKHLQRALQLNDRCGVKKDIERVERLLKKHADPVTTESAH